MSFPKRLLCFDALGNVTAHTECAHYSSVAELGCLYEFTDPIISRSLPNPQGKKRRVFTSHDLLKALQSEW